MCGIAGFAGAGDRTDIERMTRALVHRGPDGEGYHVDPSSGIHLGHRRLAIVDLAAGAQPMWNEDATVGVVFNGEIYNHAELRSELVSAGHRFASDHSDTEVLVHGYEEWGADLPRRLNGMFAFAIYDSRRGRLFLARDRFGEKPLYYVDRDGLFAFASEITALARHRDVTLSIDPLGLAKLFGYGYVPAPRTVYRGIAKLPAGCSLTVDRARAGRARIETYWRFALAPSEPGPGVGEAERADELRSLLSRAIERRLMSDVPLGVFLSGGIDSSAIVALLSRLRDPSTISTFTMGFDDPSFDESEPAALVAGHFATRHYADRLSLSQARSELPDVLSRLDEPFADPSLLPSHLVSRFARRHVTVALSGDGGDELFAGYDPFDALAPAAAYDRAMPATLHRLLRRLAGHLPVSTGNMSLDFKVKRTLMGLSYPPPMRLAAWMSPEEPALHGDLLDQAFPAEEVYSEAIELWDECRGCGAVEQALLFFTRFYLQEDILLKSDRAAMMCSLETRAVFLDNDLVEFCARLPTRFKYARGRRKILLKRALEPLLPPTIVNRPKKGFGLPISAWLRTWPPPAFDAVPGVRPDAIARRWREHAEGRADHRIALWCWLTLAAGVSTSRGARLAQGAG